MTAMTATNEAEGDQIKVYVGPTLHRRAMVAASSYRGGLPDYVTRLAEKIPELVWMIVPLAEVAAVRARIKEQGTQENGIYQYLQNVRFDANGEVRK